MILSAKAVSALPSTPAACFQSSQEISLSWH
jgi:hypothetical protein